MIFPIVQPVVYRGTVSDLRVSAVDDTAFVDNLDITLGDHISSSWESLASGSVTRANSRISAVDGTAFYDFGSGTNLTDNLGKYLIVKDSTGKAIKGWIKAAGSGETLGSELVTNGTFDSDTGWTKGTGWSIDGGVAVAANATSALSQNGAVVGALMVLNWELVSRTVGQVTAYGALTPYQTVPGTYQHILTRGVAADTIGPYFYGIGFSGTIDNISFKQVLTPSSTGATITSTKNGTTYNWESQETGFNYNDASGYTYEVFDRDFTALVGGTHLVEIYDSTGKAIAGVLGAQGSGETLGSELFPALDNPANFTNVDASWTIGEGNAVSNGNGDFHKASIVQLNALIYSSTNIVSHPSGTIYYPYSGQGSEQVMMFGTGVKTRYRTWIGVNVYLLGRSTFVGTLTDISMKQVLTPSVQGCTIVSSKGGATERFKRIDTGFAFNSSSYTVIIKKLRG